MAILSTLVSWKDLPAVGACVLVLLLLAVRAGIKRRQASVGAATKPTAHSTKTSEKDKQPGEWVPVDFEYPRLEPSKEHFSTVKPIPYRPFKWGDYHITMGIRSMPWDEWFEFDREFPQYHRVVEHRFRTRGNRVASVHPEQPGIVPSGQAAAEEFMYEVSEYLSRRHPYVYRVTRKPVSKKPDENGWYGEGKIKTITLVPFNETYDLEKDEPLRVARMLVQEDFALMLEGTDGRYYLQAGAVVIAGSWRLEDKLGMPLEDIHISGNVPQYQTKLHTSMDRFFRRFPLDKPVIRNNYSVQLVQEPQTPVPDPDELAWAETMNGSEDTSEFERAKHINDQVDATPAEHAKREGYPASRTNTPVTPRTVRLRSERQTLRRLPRTGAVVFMMRVYQTPFEELMREPGVPGRIASAIRSWPEDVARYKARDAYEDILPLLDQCHQEQIEQGLVKEDEKKSNFPF
ncbi:hypothetical protein BD413DRAFT_46218 [Trametes elegans]|nr:hypothetical protein BD413DRAFT_46218 [Trametes elegans]